MVEFNQTDTPPYHLRLLPNRSASWSDTKWLMLVMVFFVMVIAIAWAFVGAWVILPFAGIEVGLLAYIMYRVSLSTYRLEEIIITSEDITVNRGRIPLSSFQESHQLKRTELHIEITETENDWHLPQINIVTPSKTLTIGTFLSLQDRKALTEYLQNLGIPNCRTHWWKNH